MKDRSTKLFAAAFALALLGGALLMKRMRGAPDAEPPERFSLPAPERASANEAPGDDDPEEDRLMAGGLGGALAGRSDMDYGEFLTLVELAAQDDKDVAQKVKDELANWPKLGEAAADFKKRAKGGERLTAGGVLQAFHQSADFKSMVGKLARDPAVTQAVWKFYQKPELAGLKGEHLRTIFSGGKLPPAKVGHAAPAPVRLAAAGPATSRVLGTGGAQTLSHLASGGPGTAGGGALNGSSPRGPETSQPGAHHVGGPLAPIAAAGPSDQKIEAFCRLYPQFCEGAPPSIKPAFRPLAENDALVMQYGLWGACFRLGIFDQCSGACVGGCRPMEAWSACLDGYDRDEPGCIAKCLALTCAIPSDVWTRHCVPAPPAKAPTYCTSGCPADRRETRLFRCSARFAGYEYGVDHQRSPVSTYQSCSKTPAQLAAAGVPAGGGARLERTTDQNCPMCWRDHHAYNAVDWWCSRMVNAPEWNNGTGTKIDIDYYVSCELGSAEKNAMLGSGWTSDGRIGRQFEGNPGEWRDTHQLSRCRP
ncbi:MAG: hypothetical protein HY925_09860 [Elusimicrobia bacterium]|nr:hypothetical protein [Elusimicrobiota bacterium]